MCNRCSQAHMGGTVLWTGRNRTGICCNLLEIHSSCTLAGKVGSQNYSRLDTGRHSGLRHRLNSIGAILRCMELSTVRCTHHKSCDSTYQTCRHILSRDRTKCSHFLLDLYSLHIQQHKGDKDLSLLANSIVVGTYCKLRLFDHIVSNCLNT